MRPHLHHTRVRGSLVDHCTVGSIIFLKTTEGLYAMHTSWVPAFDDHDVRRIRKVYEQGDFSTYELARMYGISQAMVQQVTSGVWGRRRRKSEFLTPIDRGKVRRPRSSA